MELKRIIPVVFAESVSKSRQGKRRRCYCYEAGEKYVTSRVGQMLDIIIEAWRYTFTICLYLRTCLQTGLLQASYITRSSLSSWPVEDSPKCRNGYLLS